MFKLNVYDKEGNVTKTVTGEPVDIKFGQVRDIMTLLDAENIDSTWELVEAIHNAWDKLVIILSEAFPDVTYDEWENVPIRDLIPAMWDVIKISFSELTKVPKDPK